MSIKAVAAVTLGLLNAGCAISQTASAPSMDERIERGQAYVPTQRVQVPQDWIDSRCNATRDATRRNGKTLEQCADEAAAQLPAFEPTRYRTFGEQYNPREYRSCLASPVRNLSGGCERFALRRIESPYIWPYEHNKNFKWPDAPKEPVYRAGMSSEAYFQALCEKEAGQWVYRSVPDVQGYYQVRLNFQKDSQVPRRDRYVVENPFDYYVISTFALANFSPPSVSKNYFQFAERPRFESKTSVWTNKFSKHTVDYERKKENVEVQNEISSRYGVIWREIERPLDRENYIAGVEWGVVDLQTNELLGVLRSFMKGADDGWGFEASKACPQQIEKKQWPLKFVKQVLQPLSSKSLGED